MFVIQNILEIAIESGWQCVKIKKIREQKEINLICLVHDVTYSLYRSPHSLKLNVLINERTYMARRVRAKKIRFHIRPEVFEQGISCLTTRPPFKV